MECCNFESISCNILNGLYTDKILKVKLKDNESKILFIHVEVQSYSMKESVFAERMYRYFYRIWDKFRYKYEDKSEIVGAVIYTYKGDRGKDTRYVYRVPEIKEDILIYNFKTIDVESIQLEGISEDNPIKLVFKMAKSLLQTEMKDEEIYKAKIKLAEDLANYDKIKNTEQIKALVDFLEYLFLIEDVEINKKYEDYKMKIGGAFKMSIEEIRKIHYVNVGIEQGVIKSKKEDILDNLKELGDLSDEVIKMVNEQNNVETLRKWSKISARVNSIEEFKEKI